MVQHLLLQFTKWQWIYFSWIQTKDVVSSTSKILLRSHTTQCFWRMKEEIHHSGFVALFVCGKITSSRPLFLFLPYFIISSRLTSIINVRTFSLFKTDTAVTHRCPGLLDWSLAGSLEMHRMPVFVGTALVLGHTWSLGHMGESQESCRLVWCQVSLFLVFEMKFNVHVTVFTLCSSLQRVPWAAITRLGASCHSSVKPSFSHSWMHFVNFYLFLFIALRQHFTR